MDGVIVDFVSAFPKLSKDILNEYEGRLDEIPGIFSVMEPMKGAIEAIPKLAKKYNTYVLSTAPWKNNSAWGDKVEWIKKYFPEIFYKRLILSHNKHLNKGDFLIDDRLKNGANKFEGKHIHFGTEKFPDWQAVLDYLM